MTARNIFASTPLFLALFALLAGPLACGEDDGGSPSASNEMDAGASEPESDAGGDTPDQDGSDAQTPDAGPPADDRQYTKIEHWLCHPDKADGPCHENLDVTVVEADGTTRVEPFEIAAEPDVDCFYVYPTMSMDQTPNSDLVPGEEEAFVTFIQAARLQAQCRVFAPVYRQVTITGLFTQDEAADFDLAYADVLEAFEHYLETQNQGRPIVLLGHSQGTRMLTRLVKEHFDTTDLRQQLVAAYLIGLTIEVPEGELVGGTFEKIPLCQREDETGCVVTFATYRATAPPGEGALFGITNTPNMKAGCTNPADLSGGRQSLRAILPTLVPAALRGFTRRQGPFDDSARDEEVTTGLYSLPGMVEGECVDKGGHQYVEIHLNIDPEDPRADDVPGDLILDGWGLHLMDVNLAFDDMSELMRAQAAAFLDQD